MKTVNLTYTSPSYPPLGIEVHRGYELNQDMEGYYVSNRGESFYFDYEVIKQLFTPVGLSWEEVEKENNKPSKVKAVESTKEDISTLL